MQKTDYQTFVPMLNMLSYRAHQRSGIDQEELFSESCLIFTECKKNHKPELSAFSTWTYQQIQFRLMNYCYSTITKNTHLINSQEFDEKTFPAVEVGEPWIDFKSGFSESAQQVIDLVLLCPEELLNKTNNRKGIQKRFFSTWLHKYGYTWKQAEEIWREIKKELQ